MKKLLIVGQTPAPWHGQAVATKMLFDCEWPGLDVRCLRMAYSEELDQVGRLGLRKLFHLWRLIRETRRFLKRHPGSILLYPPASPHWTPFLRDSVYLLLVRRLAGKTVFLFHAGGFGEFFVNSRIKRALGRSYLRPDLCLEVAKEEIAPHQALECPAWAWTPYGVDVPEVKRSKKASTDRVVVLFVGSLQEGKGVLEVVRTARHLMDAGHVGRFEFRLVGRWFSSSFREETLKLVKELGVSEMIRFPGQKTGDAKWREFANADIFFFPSHYSSEAFPIVVIEALGSGLPVVSTRWRGIPSIVDGSGVARLCPVRQTVAFADALMATAAQLEEAPAISERARQFYAERYTPKHFVERIRTSIEPLFDSKDESPNTSPPRTSRDNANLPLDALQLFNQYLERGGEELWVDQMLVHCPPLVAVRSLRFQSRAWIEKSRPNRLRQASLIWNNPASRRQLREEVARQRPDVLIFHNILPVGSLGLYSEARSLGLPVVQYIHNFRPFSPSGTLWVKGRTCDDSLNGHVSSEILNAAWEGSLAKTGLLGYYLKRFLAEDGLEMIDRWIAVSDFMRSKFIDAGVPAKKIFTLRHCWKPNPEPVMGMEGDYYLFLGRLVPEKGVHTLIAAWSKLEAEMGKLCPRLIIGGTGPEEARVNHAALNSKTISFRGFVSGREKNELLANCRALIAPSIWWEPLGLTVYEAYDFRRPVLASSAGGLSETVQHGKTGFLHQPGDADELMQSVMRMETSGSDIRSTMGLTGRHWLETSANPDCWRRDLHHLLSGITES